MDAATTLDALEEVEIFIATLGDLGLIGGTGDLGATMGTGDFGAIGGLNAIPALIEDVDVFCAEDAAADVADAAADADAPADVDEDVPFLSKNGLFSSSGDPKSAVLISGVAKTLSEDAAAAAAAVSAETVVDCSYRLFRPPEGIGGIESEASESRRIRRDIAAAAAAAPPPPPPSVDAAAEEEDADESLRAFIGEQLRRRTVVN